MKRIFTIFTLFLMIMASPFNSMGKDKKVIDFNYPQDVSKEALADLDKALKSGNGQLTVDALVRYSIAQSGISQDNMADIVSRIETTIQKEKRPHIKALLYHLEALIYKGYRDRYSRWSDRNNPVEEVPKDISEWDRQQFDKKITELIEKSLAEPEALKAVAVTSLPDIIECNELGATYVPTLHEFMLMKGMEMLQSMNDDNEDLLGRIKTDWLATTEGNVPAHIYALTQTQPTISLETYKQYQDNEHCVNLLNYITWENNKEHYKVLQEYVKRFPDSPFATDVKNRIIQLEAQNVHLVYPLVRSSRDDITVTANVENANSFTIEVYRIPDEILKNNMYRYNKSQLQFISRHPVTVQGNVPFRADNVETILPPLPYGAYIIMPSIENGTGQSNEMHISSSFILHVTDITLFSVSRNDHKDLVAAVDITTGKPLPEVTINDNKGETWGKTGNDGTCALPIVNKKGHARNNSHQLIGVKGDDRYGLYTTSNVIYEGRGSSNDIANIFTDLSVYRPGETIQWSAIIYNATDKGRSALSGKTVEAIFKDTNRKLIDTLSLTTDEYGRIEGSFVVPKDRMNGNFFIQLKDKSKNKDIAWHNVNVSEYKTPTFEVTFPDPRLSYVAGQPVKVTGNAMTYSGMPVQNTEVRLSLIQSEWSWWWWSMRNDDGQHIMDTTVMTDTRGNFTIEYPAELFKENIGYKPGRRCWARYNYQVVATVTTDAGETHEESTSFIVGTRRGIELGSINNDIYLNDKPIKLPLKYNTTDEEHPDTWCTWEVTPLGEKEPVKTGNLNTADPTIDLTSLPSGQYKLKLHILDAEEGEEDVDAERVITIYRKGDKSAPVKDCPLWLTPLEQSVNKNNVGHITVGVSTPKAYIYYVASTCDEVISQGWLTYDKGMYDFTVQLPKEAGKDVTVKFITYYGSKLWEKTVTLQNPYKAEAVKITATSFRDKLVPGNMEHWTFNIIDQNGKPVRAAMILDMFDKAIASIQSNDWTFNNWRPNFNAFRANTTQIRGQQFTWASWMGKMLDYKGEANIELPWLYTYNQDFFSYGYSRGRRMMKSLGAAPTNAMYDEVKAEDEIMTAEVALSMDSNEASADRVISGQVLDAADGEPLIGASVQGMGVNEGTATDVEGRFTLNLPAHVKYVKVSYVGYATRQVAVSSTMIIKLYESGQTLDEVVVVQYGGGEVNEENLDMVTVRESDVKTALWRPMLTSDDKGNVQVEFEVPNFNTTWIAQAVAWDENMIGSTWMAEVLTQKPLMVRSNMPRFLRQGDKATLAATVQNATDEAAACDAVIELFDPRTNDVYATRNFNLQLDPNGSQAVTIDWQVPDTIAFVGFRIKAANSTFGDGEQVMVPVLTTISPVIETQPFYVEAGQGHFEQPLPKFPKDARVTLEYCDNPVWYCVLALPTIWDDNYNVATSAAHSLFALQVAQGVAKSQPQIKEAIDYWKQHNEDSTLVSMLQKNQDLKIGTLLASPWVRDADRQTLRMSRLNELFDEALMAKEYEKIITALQNLQMGDGGFTWFRHPYCQSNAWTTGAVLELIGETKHLGYLPDDSRLTSMINRALNYYDSETVRLYNEAKKYSKEPEGQFTDYAYIRTLFPEVKQTTSSANLLKMVLKYMDKKWGRGISLKEKAFYAMTLNRNGYQKTARNIIESIRQFAIVKPELGMYWDNLQTGYGWWEFDKVVYTSTILQAMNEVDPRQQEIDLVRKWMLLMKQSNDWGTRSLAADAVFSILSTGSQWLERAANPTITVAGQPIALDKMAQYVGYFRTTLPATTTGNVVIDRTGSGPAWGAVYSQFKAPMTQINEVAIQEMSISKEYYVYAADGSLHSATSFKVGDKVKVRVIIKTNKDMDFVTMTDERAACFEPVDQLSGYRNEDNTWFYQETKDTQTNVFINSLSKGTHIIGYDVWVTNPGEFTSGIATIQCQYAPQLSAHSAGKTITITDK